MLVGIFKFSLKVLLRHVGQGANVIARLLAGDSTHELIIGSAAQFHNLQQLVDICAYKKINYNDTIRKKEIGIWQRSSLRSAPGNNGREVIISARMHPTLQISTVEKGWERGVRNWRKEQYTIVSYSSCCNASS